jgi:hypothetical protein
VKELVAKWRRKPSTFVRDVLRNPETGQPFVLYPAEVEFIDRAFALTPQGELPCPELLFSAPKKSGKTALAAMCALYVAVAIGGLWAEVYCLANDLEQANSRVWEAARRMVEAAPLLKRTARITARRIEFTSTGAHIDALASDYAGFAGANPSLTIFDELWGYISESSRRLYDEAAPSPTRKVSGRLVVSYAGFTGESDLLEGLYQRALAGERIGTDLYRNGAPCSPTGRTI